MPELDPTVTPRAGEEIDEERLRTWLRGNFPEAEGEVSVRQFPSGHSNLTYLVCADGHEWVLRRPPHGSTVKTAHDMSREYRVLSKLHAVYPPAPRALAYCDDPAVLGAPFYLMERRIGIAIRKTLPEGIATDPATLRRVSESVIDRLADLHAVDPAAAGLNDFGKPQGYIARQIAGWSKRWNDARTGPLAELDEL